MPSVIINHSEVHNANRLDSEYFQPKFLELQKKLIKGKFRPLRELCEFIRTGPAGSALPSSVYIASGIKVYRPSNLNGWTCDNANIITVSEDYCQQHNLHLYLAGDILITRIGDIKFGIIEEEKNRAVTISSNMVALRPKRELLDALFLLAFFHTKFGLGQIQRGTKIVSLASVGIGSIANMLIPTISIKEQRKIGNLVKSGLSKQRLAKKAYSRTEDILLQTTSFKKIKNIQSSVITSLSKVRLIRRSDAEYFISQKKTNKRSLNKIELGEIVKIFRGINPGRNAYQDKGKLFLRVGNISKYGLLEKSQKYIAKEIYKKLNKKYQPQNGEVLLVKDGKPGVAYTLHKSMEGIISEGIVRLKLNPSFRSEYISLCINSPICQQDIEVHIDGSLMPHWKVEQIKKLQIPIVPIGKQLALAKSIKKCTALFQEGNNTLQAAKEQVENLIENL